MDFSIIKELLQLQQRLLASLSRLNRPFDVMLSTGRFFSNHASVFCSFRSYPTKRVTFGSYKSFSLDSFLSDLSALPLIVEPSTSFDLLVEKYNDGLSSLLDFHEPLRTKSVKLRPSAPWINDEVRRLRKAFRKAERIWRRRKLTIYLDIFMECQRAFNRLLVSTKLVF